MEVRAHLEQFGELLVRDYLRSKGLEKTMAAFDEELSAARADCTDASADNSAARRVTACLRFGGNASRGRSMSLNALATEHSIKNIAFVPASIGAPCGRSSAMLCLEAMLPLVLLLNQTCCPIQSLRCLK